MKILKKQALTAISLILIMAFAATMTCMQTVQAAPNVNVKDWAYVDPQPDVVGVGQPVVVIYGIDHVNPLASAAGPFFEGFTLAITDPNGNTQSQSVTVDSTSFGHITFTPDKVGNYSFVLSFAGQWVNMTAGMMTFFGPAPNDVNYYYEPASSNKEQLTVQQEPVTGVQRVPLPNNYWTTPIYSENKGSATTIDNWLMLDYDQTPRSFNGMGAFSPITTGPSSSHILWTKPLQFGGLAGAKFDDKSLYHSEVYEQYYVPLILNGRIYYIDHGPTQTGVPGSTGSNRIDNFGTRCLDLYTGQEVFYLTNVTIDMAQTLDVEFPNEHGVVSYLWSIPGIGNYNPLPSAPVGQTWEMYDAFTGNKILTIQNAVGGAPTFGPNGEILIYTLDPAGHWMALWNSTKCVLSYAPPGGIAFYGPSRGTVLDWSAGLQWNVTLNAPHAIGIPVLAAISYNDSRLLVLYDNRLFYPTDQTTYPAIFTDCAYPAILQTDASGNYPTTVDPVWVQNRTDIYDVVETHYNINQGMYSVFDDGELKMHTYDINTGNQLSVSQAMPNSGPYTLFAHTWMAYGNTYVWSYDGHVRCVDGKTGNVTWDTSIGDLPYGQAYAVPPVYQGPTIADGKVYIGGSDHSPDSDMWVGSKMWCLDAYTGAMLWNISGYYGYSAVSNGYLTTYNGYNVEIYTYGKGPSTMTVTAPDVGVTTATPVRIRGTVMDVSAGAKQDVVAANYPGGLPCVSDASQSQWMEHVYMQQPLPSNTTGVLVSIDVLDSNGNFRSIGTATTDATGNFGFTWTPDIPGDFTVFASFAGSNSYYASSAETSFHASEAATPPPSATPITGFATTGDLMTYMAVSVVAIIIAIAIAVVLLLRKRP
jgi:outer membrane protein assembly factor BamB